VQVSTVSLKIKLQQILHNFFAAQFGPDFYTSRWNAAGGNINPWLLHNIVRQLVDHLQGE
jgi:hypothetical protein